MTDYERTYGLPTDFERSIIDMVTPEADEKDLSTEECMLRAMRLAASARAGGQERRCAHNWRFVADGLRWKYHYETGGSTTRTEPGYYCASCLSQRKYEAADGE